MNHYNVKDILILATELILSRNEDINLTDGCYATVYLNSLIDLENALTEVFELDSDTLNDNNVNKLVSRINNIDVNLRDMKEVNINDTI